MIASSAKAAPSEILNFRYWKVTLEFYSLFSNDLLYNEFPEYVLLVAGIVTTRPPSPARPCTKKPCKAGTIFVTPAPVPTLVDVIQERK